MRNTPFLLAAFVHLFSVACAQPANVSFSSCLSDENSASPSKRINVSTVYAQITPNPTSGRFLNLTVIGVVGEQIIESSNVTNLLATLFTSTQVLTFDVWNNSTDFCKTVRPPSPLPTVNGSDYCPVAAGPVAFATSIPLTSAYELETLSTQLRVVDTSNPAVELACVQVEVTPLVPGLGSPYGHAKIIFWVTVALSVAYWAVVGIARIVGAWGRGAVRTESGLWPRMKNAGYILASALSGERLASTPALLRFATPSLRDVLLFTQWTAALGMIAVQWPRFVYPFFAQAAWATLVYNITFTQGVDRRWNPFSTPPYDPPSYFADQLSDLSSPLFVNQSIPNELFLLPEEVQDGISSFAYTLGLKPQDLFGVCLGIFLCIVGATILFSAFLWAADWIVASINGPSDRRGGAIRGDAYNIRYSNASKDLLDGVIVDDNNAFNSPSNTRRAWWRHRLGQTSFHGSILIGNLVRMLVFFHFPITLFSCYQLTLGPSHASVASFVLAVLSFVGFSILLPAYLTVRVMMTTTNKLYGETHTLLALGPLYNTFSQDSQSFAGLFFLSNLIFGITIGCGQHSGSAQAIVILVVEVAAALGTSVWLPWGHGAAMGLISFLYCVARIVVAVLVIILTPIVSVGENAGGWIAYAILFVLGLIYMSLSAMLALKCLEAVLRIAAHIPFNRSKHTVDSGLLGVLGILLGRSNSRRHRRKRSSNDIHTPSSRPETPGSKHTLATQKATESRQFYGQPSVLRPDEASRPYQEEGDDENGYIMGAWQPFPLSAYSPVQDKFLDSPPATKTGFSRVGGGRAHYDSPYAIKSGTAQTPANNDRGSPARTTRVRSDELEMAPGTVPRHTAGNVPAGPSPPLHSRTKSQTAIIEDASTLVLAQPVTSSIVGSWPGDSSYAGPDTQAAEPTVAAATDSSQNKRRNWLTLLRGPRRTSETDASEEHDDFAPKVPSGQTSSFVVIRNPRPMQTRRPSSYAEPSTLRTVSVVRSGAKPLGDTKDESPPRASSSPWLFPTVPASPTTLNHTSRRLSNST